MRHTEATVLAHLGVAPQIIQRRLGHSTIGTTMDMYAHEMPNEDAAAAEMLDQIFGSDKEGKDFGADVSKCSQPRVKTPVKYGVSEFDARSG